MKKALFLLATILFSNEAHSEATDSPKELFAIHPKVAIGAVSHSSSFNYLNDIISCGKFESGNGISFGVGAGFELALTNNLFADLGIYYKSMTADFEIDKFSFGYDIKNQKSTILNVKNKIAANLGYFKLEPGIKYIVSNDFINGPLLLNVGFGFGIPLSNTFSQEESIQSPENAYFINDGKKLKTRQLFDGNISSMSSVLVSMKLGLENQLKMSDNMSFTQSLGFEYNINDIVSYSTWKALDISFALGLRYSIKEAEKVVPPPPPAPVVEEKIIEKPKPILAFKFAKDSELNGFVLNTGNQLAATQTLLNVVFFDKNSAIIPSNYELNAKDKVDYNKLTPVNAQKYNLIRIAELLNSSEKAKVVISGASSGIQNESEGLELAKKRAENVAKALIDLGVSPKKIDTKWAIAPANPTNQEFKEGIEENQRVDINLKNAFLQEYVFKQNYAEISGKIKYYVNMQNFEDNSPANIKFSFPDTTLKVSKAGEYTLAFTKRIPATQDEIEVSASIEKDELKQSDTQIIKINNLKKNVVNLQTKEFKAIIRFDYNSSKLSDDNKELVKELIQVLPANSTIKILGSADQLGSDIANQKLEDDRANSTQEYIKSLNSNIKIITGKNLIKFDDSTAAGRFLNRSIILTIEL